MTSDDLDLSYTVCQGDVKRIIGAALYCQMSFKEFIEMAIKDKLAEIEIAMGEIE